MEQAWVWIYKENGKTHNLFMDAGEVIRFRVVKEIFTEAPLSSAPNAPRDISEKPEANNVAPYTLHGSIDEPGLGLVTWWETA
ncbi:DNA-directed RNA polymerase III subunit RPC8 [Temnothorax longispinosus]|nr:DNA-directed RNA polymerase III subunit RPC8 [Temnothorax longispinosus]